MLIEHNLKFWDKLRQNNNPNKRLTLVVTKVKVICLNFKIIRNEKIIINGCVCGAIRIWAGN